jgi:hypothetical protein
VFLRPLQVSSFVDKKDVIGVFSNIETIYEVNSQLLKLFGTQAIGQAFLSMADGFKSYVARTSFVSVPPADFVAIGTRPSWAIRISPPLPSTSSSQTSNSSSS